MFTEKNDKFDKIITLYKQGYSCKDICEKCDMSVLTVRTYLRKAGFDTRNYRKVSENNKDKVILLIKNGYSYRQIESLLHISTHLIREIVIQAGLIGFAPKYHHPVELQVQETEISSDAIRSLNHLYMSGEYGLAKCAAKLQVSDEEFLWFVFHLTKANELVHFENLKKNIHKMLKNQLPVTAIAKKMDISLSIVKKFSR